MTMIQKLTAYSRIIIPCLLALWGVCFPAMFPPEAGAGPFNRNEAGMAGLSGYSGILEMPDARVLPDWQVRLGFGYPNPHYNAFATLGLFDRVELNARWTGFPGEDNPRSPGGGDLKDKALDVKFLLVEETEGLPAIALGALDVAGDGLFTGRYLAVSKRYGRFNVTTGLGQGLLGGRNKAERDDIGGGGNNGATHYLFSWDDQIPDIFGGLEYAATEDLVLSAEYTPISYESLPGGDEADFPINIGAKYRLWDGLYVTAALTRGEKLSGGVFWQFPLDPEGPWGWEREPAPIREERDVLAASAAEDRELAEILAAALCEDGFDRVKVIVASPHVWVELDNNRYNYPGLAWKRAFEILDVRAPISITRMYLIVTDQGLFYTGLGADREHLRSYVENRVDAECFLEFALMTQDRPKLWTDFCRYGNTPYEAADGEMQWAINFEPRLSLYLDDADSEIQSRLSVDVTGEFRPWAGGLMVATASVPVHNELSPENYRERPKNDVNGLAYESRDDLHLVSYGYDQMWQLPREVQARFGFGAFEAAWMGMGGEVFRYFADGRFGVGLEGALVWKRDLENDLRLSDAHSDPYHTFHLNLYGRPLPGTGIEMGLRLGRFLGRDYGLRMDLCRTFKHFTVGAWYTVTDSGHFLAEQNRDYHDKGVYIAIPLSIFDSKPRPGRLRHAVQVRPRDTGRMVNQFRSLYPLGREAWTTGEMKKHIQEMQW